MQADKTSKRDRLCLPAEAIHFRSEFGSGRADSILFVYLHACMNQVKFVAVLECCGSYGFWTRSSMLPLGERFDFRRQKLLPRFLFGLLFGFSVGIPTSKQV